MVPADPAPGGCPIVPGPKLEPIGFRPGLMPAGWLAGRSSIWSTEFTVEVELPPVCHASPALSKDFNTILLYTFIKANYVNEVIFVREKCLTNLLVIKCHVLDLLSRLLCPLHP